MNRKPIYTMFDEEETKRRFEAALRGARLAAPHPMKDIIGKSERAVAKGKNRVKKTVQARPKAP